MFDYHMHTTFSDGKNSIEEMVTVAEELGLHAIAITDHIWKTSEWFDKYCKLIKNENEKRNINILIGFEAKALSTNGEIDATKVMCNNADIKIGAIHRIPSSKEHNQYLTREDIVNNKQEAYNNWLETTKNMIINSDVDIIAHPLMALDKYSINVKENDIMDLFLLSKKYNTKLEISSRYNKSNKPLLNTLFQQPSFFQFISYGSDSHSVSELYKAHNEK